ncbi:MAG: ATP-binding cassette domain-containing protein [Verrucomicrobiota bacterium]
MIDVENLSKSYSGVQAVKDISFQVEPGEIVGFLGPNGAGKSTTMRILAGYLPPTDGRVSVAGYDVIDDSIEVRKRIGYMPENVPLYNEMRVGEYLSYRARLKHVPGAKVRDRVEEVTQLCGLEDVSRKIIGTLSKGYRQRVGLADSMVHEPDLLILDEPTIGLDPKQIRSVRELIKSLGKKHTILLSTHILPEVEMTCSRVLIIHKGRIEASDTPDNVMRAVRSGALRVEVKAPEKTAADRLGEVAGVEDVTVLGEKDGWCRLELFADRDHDIRDGVFELIKKENWALREMAPGRATLEEAFVELTQD